MASDDQQILVISNQHEYRFFPPNRCAFVLRGVLEEDDAVAYTKFIYHHADQFNTLLDATFEITTLGRVTAGARTHFMSVTRSYPLRRIGFIGASFSIKMMVTMLIRAGRVVAPDKWGFDFEFVSTIQEAEAWLNNSPKSRR